VLTLRVPPLRVRREDVLPLATQFLRQEARPLRGFTKGAQRRLLAHTWPGNVRELQNAVRHGAALAIGNEVRAEDLPEELLAAGAPSPAGVDVAPDALPTLAEVERAHVLRVLDACGGSQAQAARALGIARNTLWRKLRAYAPS
jgi:DNA-binding NtrC family response regulator